MAVSTPTAKPPRIRWTAADDRVAHASSPGHPRTLCGLPVVDERFAWPETRRCLGCRALVEELLHPSELILRAQHGDK